VERESRVAVWVGPRAKFPVATQIKNPTPSIGSGQARPQTARPGRRAPRKTGMDITWVTDRIAVGGGIWTSENMAQVASAGITHIIDMQIEFDDTPLGVAHGIEVLWNPTDDDFEVKPAELFQRGVNFAQAALRGAHSKLFIHCAAGVHRAPMMTLAVLGSMGWSLPEAIDRIGDRRPVADFADVYVRSVEAFLGKSRMLRFPER